MIAQKNPLDDRGPARVVGARPSILGERTSIAFAAGATRIPEDIIRSASNRFLQKGGRIIKTQLLGPRAQSSVPGDFIVLDSLCGREQAGVESGRTRPTLIQAHFHSQGGSKGSS
jgi:hypothetical protein